MSPEPSPPSTSPKPTEEPSASTPSTHPPFEPFFTPLSNTTTNTTLHPRVHYIFSDDDPTIVPPSRSILVDLEANSDGGSNKWNVRSASSLGGDFAVTEARIEGEGVLKVEGVQREVVGSLEKSTEGKEDLDGLLGDFRRRMGVLKTVVQQGERNAAHLKMGEEQEAQEAQEQQQQEPTIAGSGEQPKMEDS
jgi:hypothetical protein